MHGMHAQPQSAFLRPDCNLPTLHFLEAHDFDDCQGWHTIWSLLKSFRTFLSAVWAVRGGAVRRVPKKQFS